MTFMNIELEPKYRQIGYPGILFHLKTQLKGGQNLSLAIRKLASVRSQVTSLLGEEQEVDDYIPSSEQSNSEEGSQGDTAGVLGKFLRFYRSFSKYTHYSLRTTWFDAAEVLRDAIYVNHQLSDKLMKEKTIDIIDEMYEFSEFAANKAGYPDPLLVWFYSDDLRKMRTAAVRMIEIVEELIPIQNEKVASLRK